MSKKIAKVTLQFGRGCYTAEMTEVELSALVIDELQFGRGCYTAEIGAPRSGAPP